MNTPYGMFAPGASIGGGVRKEADLDPLIEMLKRAGQFVTTTSKPHWQQQMEQQLAETPTGGNMTTPVGPAVDTSGSMMTPVGPVGAPAAQAMPDISTAQTSQAGAGEQGLLDKWKSVLSGESEFSLGGLSEEERAAFAKLSPSERMAKVPENTLGPGIFNLQPSVASTPGRDPDLPDEFGTEKTQAGGVPLVSEAKINEQFGELLRPQNKFTPQDTAQPDLPDDVDAMDVDLEGMAAPEKRGLLSRLGGFAKDNPELLAQIAQAGGGLMQDIAQGRAQKAADAKTRGAMAQSNLIGALTGGKSRPAVMREEAEQGGLLARLGQAVEAGGRVAGGEMKRRTALSQRDEEMGLKGRKVAADELNAESQKAYREAMAGVYEKQLGVDDRKTAARLTSDYLKAAENQRKESRLPVKQITELASQFSTLNKLDSLEDFIVGADFSALEMGPLSLDEPSQFIFGTDPRVAQGKIQGLIMEIAQSVPGVLTEQDQKRLEQILFTMNDRPSTALDIADAFRQAKIEGLTTQLGGLKEAGGYDVSYFERQIQDYGKDKGEEGLIKLLQGTKLELE